eukprot:gene37207-50203_t
MTAIGRRCAGEIPRETGSRSPWSKPAPPPRLYRTTPASACHWFALGRRGGRSGARRPAVIVKRNSGTVGPERKLMRKLLPALAALLAFAPTAAFAHPGHGEAIGFAAGFLHPMSGLDHVLCMVAVGIFAVVLGGRALVLVPLSFVGMMVVGFLLGANGLDLPFVELAIALSSIVVGAVAASGKSMPVAAAMSLVGAFAVFHGLAHGAEMPTNTSGLEFAAGFMTATALLHAAGIVAAVVVAKLAGKHGQSAARVAGGAFALGGIGILAG